MIQIRCQTFETNSSSTHTLAIVSPEDWQRFKEDPDLYIDEYGHVMTFEEAAKERNENYGMEDVPFSDVTEDDLEEAHFVSYKRLDNNYDFQYKEIPSGGAAISCYYYD